MMAFKHPAMILKPGREKSLLRNHPWVFSGAVKEVDGNPQSGDVVGVYSSENQFLAYVAYSHSSQIVGRVWSFNEEDIVDTEFIQSRLVQAISMRSSLGIEAETNAKRLVHGESDGIPGLIVDQYDEILVVQFLSYGVEVWRETIAKILIELTGATAVFERSDAEVRGLEGLAERVGLLAGGAFADPVEIDENGVKFLVPIESGHKTGFYLDQRQHRFILRKFSKGKEVLDCFCYSGGFALNALVGGAKLVTAVENSASALDMLNMNLEVNSLDPEKVEIIQADVFKQLRKFRDQNRRFDVIVLDPPKFAPTRAHADKASRGYKDINLLAFKLLRPGGTLFTFSCSGGIDSQLFQKIVAGAALDAGVDARIVRRLSQDADHPVALNFPEGTYLKGLVCKVEG
jgi:23S rRNA (cytosine1962-C5)-methyltransferase